MQASDAQLENIFITTENKDKITSSVISVFPENQSHPSQITCKQNCMMTDINLEIPVNLSSPPSLSLSLSIDQTIEHHIVKCQYKKFR